MPLFSLEYIFCSIFKDIQCKISYLGLLASYCGIELDISGVIAGFTLMRI